jgi:hypothetical protein
VYRVAEEILARVCAGAQRPYAVNIRTDDEPKHESGNEEQE